MFILQQLKVHTKIFGCFFFWRILRRQYTAKVGENKTKKGDKMKSEAINRCRTFIQGVSVCRMKWNEMKYNAWNGICLRRNVFLLLCHVGVQHNLFTAALKTFYALWNKITIGFTVYTLYIVTYAYFPFLFVRLFRKLQNEWLRYSIFQRIIRNEFSQSFSFSMHCIECNQWSLLYRLCSAFTKIQ